MAVSAALLVSGLLLVNNQERKTRMTQALNDMREQIDGVINNVATGYYQTGEDFNCTAGLAGQPTFPLGSNERGTNSRCIYLGRAMHLNVNGVGRNFNIYTIAGRRFRPNSTSVASTTIQEAMPRAINETSAIEQRQLATGITPFRIKYNGGTASSTIFAFVSDFAGADSNGNLTSSSRSARLYAINGATMITGQGNGIILLSSGTAPAQNYVRATDVTICFRSTGTDQYGIITIGGNNKQLTTEARIVDNNPVPAECS